MPPALEACACSAWASVNVPLTSLPVLVGLGSATDSVASPAVLTTFAVVLASYSRATPGVKAPNVAGAPSVSASVGGTVPPTPPCVQSERYACWPRPSFTVVVSSTLPSAAVQLST